MTDENPYRSPEAYGTTLRPSRWLKRGWKDAPAVVCAVMGVLTLIFAFGFVATQYFLVPPRVNFAGTVVLGLLVATWGLIWIASAENWWKGNFVSAIVWMFFAGVPLVSFISMAVSRL